VWCNQGPLHVQATTALQTLKDSCYCSPTPHAMPFDHVHAVPGFPVLRTDVSRVFGTEAVDNQGFMSRCLVPFQTLKKFDDRVSGTLDAKNPDGIQEFLL